MSARRHVPLLAALIVSACGDPAGPSGPSQIAKVADISGVIAGAGDSVRVKVIDAGGAPVAGVAVNFAVSAGGGSIAPGTATTSASGIAAAKFTTGTTVGVNTATASVSGLTGSPVSFSVTSVAGAAVSIASQSGPTASLVAGASDSIKVLVKDANGNPVGGTNVTFAAAAGGGSVTAGTVATKSNGIAATLWITGPTVGANSATATVAGIAGSPIAFNVTTVAGPAAAVAVQTNLPAGTIAGAADSIRVLVKDANGNPVNNASVTFAVTAGGGALTVATVATKPTGIAATKWATGTTVGVNTVTAAVTGVTPTTLSATTVAGPAAKSGVTQRTIVVDATAGASITASVADANGNATSGALTYLSRNSGVASVSGGGVVTAVSPGATFVVVSAGGFSDSVRVLSGVTGGIALTVIDLPRFDLKTDSVFTITVAMDMRSSGEKLGSADISITWNTSVLLYQGDADPSSPMSVAANATLASTGTYKLGVASGTGAAGAVALRKLTFKVASTAGVSGSLNFSVAAVSGAPGAFANLTAKTAVASYPLKTR